MKSRTSFFNPTVFKKDITRFAPAWVLYSVGLVMILSVCMIDNSEYWRANNVAETAVIMAVINLGYGLLNGQLLFGDLFNARHCNALHAMPLRRECWFATHTIAGLAFSIVPNTVFALIAMVMCGSGWSAAAWWLLAVTIQYVFFFGLAVFSALCVGSRFAMVLIYGIINFLALIAYWFYYAIYEPLIYGAYLTTEPFIVFCPVWKMMDYNKLIRVTKGDNVGSIFGNYLTDTVTLGEGWGYLAVCGALGVGLILLALVLYRRRKLESAGDFMAVRAMEPVFLTVYALCMTAFFQMFSKLFGLPEYMFMAIGLTVGFFTGLMLLKRTTKVFRPKAFLWFVILAVVFAGSVVLTALDVFGWAKYIPDTDRVAVAYLSDEYRAQIWNGIPMDNEDDIDEVRQIHQMILDGETDGTGYAMWVNIQYQLDSGIMIRRQYNVAVSSPVGRAMEPFLSRPEIVLGTTDIEGLADKVTYMYYSNYAEDKQGPIYVGSSNVRAVLEAILADCEEGTMAQSAGYHQDPNSDMWESYAWIEIQWEDENGLIRYSPVEVYPECRHTIAYLENADLPVDIYE